MPVTLDPSVLTSHWPVKGSPVAGATGRSIRVDEKLTERRDGASVNGIEGAQETGADLRFAPCEPLTSGFGRHSSILDAEEVRGSNPLAPTGKGPGHGASSLFWAAWVGAQEPRS